jgi:hypothetical protein
MIPVTCKKPPQRSGKNTHGIPARTPITPLAGLHRRSWASASAVVANACVANAIENAATVFISFRSIFYFRLDEPAMADIF